MTGRDSADPVQRFTFSTADESETEEFIRQTYVDNQARFHDVPAGARFSAEAAQVTVAPGVAAIAVDHIRSPIDYSAVCAPFDYYLFFTMHNGRLHLEHGRDELVVGAGSCSFYPLGVRLGVHHFDLDMHILRLPISALAATAEQFTGIAAGDVRFEAFTPVSDVMARQWTALIELAGGTLLDEDSPAVHPVLAGELASTAAICALHTFPNTAMSSSERSGPGRVAPAQVRRAADLIHAHADRPLAPHQIAAAAGVGGYDLRNAFRRHYGVTPTGYLRRVRLERAYQELQDADPAGRLTVAAVAHTWGWLDPGRFAAAYERRFGEPPARTLARAQETGT